MIVWIAATVLLSLLILHTAGAGRRMARRACEVDVPDTPLGQAERILASRYARGTVTSEEYERMLAVLRR